MSKQIQYTVINMRWSIYAPLQKGSVHVVNLADFFARRNSKSNVRPQGMTPNNTTKQQGRRSKSIGKGGAYLCRVHAKELAVAA